MRIFRRNPTQNISAEIVRVRDQASQVTTQADEIARIAGQVAQGADELGSMDPRGGHSPPERVQSDDRADDARGLRNHGLVGRRHLQRPLPRPVRLNQEEIRRSGLEEPRQQLWIHSIQLAVSKQS